MAHSVPTQVRGDPTRPQLGPHTDAADRYAMVPIARHSMVRGADDEHNAYSPIYTDVLQHLSSQHILQQPQQRLHDVNRRGWRAGDECVCIPEQTLVWVTVGVWCRA